MKNSLLAASCLFALSLTACSGDPDPKTTLPDLNPLVCEKNVIEDDFSAFGPLAGPGVDSATGQLAAPPASGYVASTTYLRLRAEPEAQQKFGELMAPISMQLMTQPGLVAMQLAGSDGCGTARTLTVWESEEAMMGFVLSDAHGAAIQAVGDVSRGGSVTMHWTAMDATEASWESAAKRLEGHQGPEY